MFPGAAVRTVCCHLDTGNRPELAKTQNRSRKPFCGEGGCVRAPLRKIRKTRKFRARTKSQNRRRATRFTQTISPPVLTSVPGTLSFANLPVKSPAHILPPRRIRFRDTSVFGCLIIKVRVLHSPSCSPCLPCADRLIFFQFLLCSRT